MCGIAGIYCLPPSHGGVDPSELDRITDHMAPRGPDARGTWISADARIGLGHRRLSIIDLSPAGAQPMATALGDLVITFNGEIYNYRALRQDLIDAGIHLRSTSDTEVILQLYALKGEAMLRDLRGMYAFAIWNAKDRSLFLARDPYGIKPLYYAIEGGRFRFASSVRALVAGARLSRELDPAGLVGFEIFGSVPEPFTIHRAIKALPAGHSLRLDANGMGEPRQHASISATLLEAEHHAEDIRSGKLSARDLETRFRAEVLASVKAHLVADVPVGAFLSGGIDSGALVGLMRDAGLEDIRTVTLGFEEFRGSADDEATLAGQSALVYATHHTQRIVTAAEFEADVPAIFAAMDQPSIDGINVWLVSKAARELGLKVALSGIGGDELLGGYSTFARLPHMVSRLGLLARIPGMPDLVRAGVGSARKAGFALHPKMAGLLAHGRDIFGAYLLQRSLFLPGEVAAMLDDPDLRREGLARLAPEAYVAASVTPFPATPFARVAALESSLYLRNQLLRDTDWAGMAHSLEIRTPLVDIELLRRAAPLVMAAQSLPASHGLSGKSLLARAPTQPLPASVLHRAKTGFSLPMNNWQSRLLSQARRNQPEARDKRLWGRVWSQEVLSRYASAATATATAA